MTLCLSGDRKGAGVSIHRYLGSSSLSSWARAESSSFFKHLCRTSLCFSCLSLECQSAQAAVTKHKTGWLTQQTFILRVLEGRSPRSRFGSTHFQVMDFSLCPHGVKQESLSSSSSSKDTNPILRVPSHDLINPNDLPKTPSPNSITLGFRALTSEF